MKSLCSTCCNVDIYCSLQVEEKLILMNLKVWGAEGFLGYFLFLNW